MLNSLLGRSN